MRRSFVPVLLLISFADAAARDVAAQTAPVAVTSAELARTHNQRRRSAFDDRVLTGLGGALIGAGIGFFASQVVIGDWDDGKRRIERPVWAAVGGSVGFALGFSFPFSGKTRPGGPPVQPAPRGEGLGAAEIARTSARDAYDAVRLLRPQWLRERGTHVFGETPGENIRVYLDGDLLGSVAALKTISVTTVASIEFLDTAAATLRWGAGHNHGAILVVGN